MLLVAACVSPYERVEQPWYLIEARIRESRAIVLIKKDFKFSIFTRVFLGKQACNHRRDGIGIEKLKNLD